MAARIFEKQVARAIQDHFSDYTPSELSFEVDGACLRDEITAIKTFGRRLSVGLINQLRAKYAMEGTSAQILVVKDPSQNVPCELNKACELALTPETKKRTLKPLVAFLTHYKEEYNQRMMVGICHVVLKRRSVSNAQNGELAYAFVKAVTRQTWEGTFVAECECMKGPFDEALVAQFIALQGVGMSTTEIWKEIRPHCHLVLDVATADRIIEHKDRWRSGPGRRGHHGFV